MSYRGNPGSGVTDNARSGFELRIEKEEIEANVHLSLY